jgi:hypothetical protein
MPESELKIPNRRFDAKHDAQAGPLEPGRTDPGLDPHRLEEWPTVNGPGGCGRCVEDARRFFQLWSATIELMRRQTDGPNGNRTLNPAANLFSVVSNEPAGGA